MRFLLVTGNLEPRNGTRIGVIPQLGIILIDDDMFVKFPDFNDVVVGLIWKVHDVAIQSVDLEFVVFEPSVPAEPVGRTRVANANATLSVPTTLRNADRAESRWECNEVCKSPIVRSAVLQNDDFARMFRVVHCDFHFLAHYDISINSIFTFNPITDVISVAAADISTAPSLTIMQITLR